MKIRRFDGANIVPIVGDGAIADSRWAEGRFIPVLIVDCAQQRDLYESIMVHINTPPGDVTASWFKKVLDGRNVFLLLKFLRPVTTEAILCFRLEKQAILVDGIIRARGVYLQPLQSGATVQEGMGKPKILVEIPATATFPGDWSQEFRRVLTKRNRERGMPRAEARRLADEHVKSAAELWARRAKGGNGRHG